MPSRATLPPGEAHTTLGVGALIVAGGAVAYLRRGSVASLAGASAFGGVYLACGWFISRGESVGEAHAAAGLAGLTMGGVMGARFARTGKVFPPGLLAAIGLVSSAYELSKAREWLA